MFYPRVCISSARSISTVDKTQCLSPLDKKSDGGEETLDSQGDSCLLYKPLGLLAFRSHLNLKELLFSRRCCCSSEVSLE
ncbi:hypothetical protein DsansV1_C07g0075361 [Dioscorea sansibarensis]